MTNKNLYTEEEIIKLLVAGNQFAFKKLYMDYYKNLYAYSLKFTKSAELSEEIVQEVFIKVWENREKFSQVQSFKSYVYSICKNTILNYLSRAAKEKKIKNQILASSLPYHTDTENSLIAKEYESIINKAIEQLPPQRKLIFKLCKVDGKTYEEVASSIGISSGTVNDHMVKAGKSIKEYLQLNNITFFFLIILALLVA